jgi:hypothetical protein
VVINRWKLYNISRFQLFAGAQSISAPPGASHFLSDVTMGRIVFMNLMVDYPGAEESHPRLETIPHAYILSEFKRRLDKSIQPLHLVEFLALGNEYEATNPRNKVYALLGLAATGSRLQPSYKLPVETVYANATRYVINESQDLAILAAVEERQDGTNSRNNYSLPSWVPNFNIPAYAHFRLPLVAANLPPT